MGQGLDKPGMGGSGKCEPRGAKGLPVSLPKLDQGKVVEGSNCWQRCRSVFNIGGYNSAFLPFFRDFEILGGIFRFCRFFKF